MDKEMVEKIRLKVKNWELDSVDPGKSGSHKTPGAKKPDPSIPYLRRDETFGDQGKLELRPSPEHSLLTATSIVRTNTDHSKFWVAAFGSIPATGANYAAIARITAEGTMDSSFMPETNGFAQVKFDDENSTRTESVHETQDGSLLVFGEQVTVAGATSYRKPMITKILTNGQPDNNFGTDGVVDVDQTITDVGPIGSALYIVDQDDGILVLGQVDKEDHTDTDAFLARLTPTGQRDENFKIVRIHKDDNSVDPVDMVKDGTGRIIITCNSLNHRYLLVLKSNGTLDREFGEQGFVDISAHFFGVESSTLTQGSSHVFLSGSRFDPKMMHAVLANYTTEGRLEPTFNDGKPAQANFGKGYVERVWYGAHESASAPYTIKVLGWYADNDGRYQVVGRYLPNGTADYSFVNNHAIGQVPAEAFFAFGKQNLINDTSGRFLVAGRWSGTAAIFAFKD